jgi:hypothetical protein
LEASFETSFETEVVYWPVGAGVAESRIKSGFAVQHLLG